MIETGAPSGADDRGAHAKPVREISRTPHTSEPSGRRISMPIRGVSDPHGGPTRRLLQSVIACGRCGGPMRSSWQTRYETGWRGPTPRESYAYTRSLPRYVCRDFGHTSVLAEPTEMLAVAAVELRRRCRLPNGIERQRAAIAAEILRLEILPPDQPGRTHVSPRRLRIVWTDGTSTTGTSLPHRAIPWQSWPYNRPATAPEPASHYPADVWAAIFRAAGATN
jgi:hypothetical protein